MRSHNHEAPRLVQTRGNSPNLSSRLSIDLVSPKNDFPLSLALKQSTTPSKIRHIIASSQKERIDCKIIQLEKNSQDASNSCSPKNYSTAIYKMIAKRNEGAAAAHISRPVTSSSRRSLVRLAPKLAK